MAGTRLLTVHTQLHDPMAQCHLEMVTDTESRPHHRHRNPSGTVLLLDHNTMVKDMTALEEVRRVQRVATTLWLALISSQRSPAVIPTKKDLLYLPQHEATVLSLERGVMRILIMVTSEHANRMILQSANADHKSTPLTGKHSPVA
jgi:hypothetical protein